ncbi:unnamed protein product [Acanthoscelides obtectus]|uniref:Deleted in lung and esophageal cancer protein 1 n=1 Tax=Acanthoscelides obtectus TaxID=200917 RepID=A0A9P0KER0_ACAOB|nr:unnamed protein product [Acanthoscelides obtectus]CAK1648380.1 Deleted in lung and esophageal cancer protein 1 homolog [Acanthoscelides obtectus]
MDAPPLIQEDKGHTNTAPVLRKSFQDALQQPWYPAVVARNILQNKPDDGVGLIHPAVKVLEIYGNYQDTCEVLQRAENDIMTQQGRHIIEKNRIDCDNTLQGVKLKHCKLFGNIKSDLWKHFGLLSLFDLMPDALQIHLNFFYNDKMVCENCLNETHTKSIKEKKHHKMRKAMKNTEMTTTSYDTSILYGTQILKQQDLKPTKNIKVVPSSIVYSNFEVGKKYKRIVRIINATHTLQSIMISQYPKFKYFHVELDLTAKLAAGMSVTATITFSPTVYRNVLDKVIFRNSKGEEVALPITTFREDPQLRIFVLKNDQFVDFPSSLVFSEKRRAALNYTIDCGSCLISEFVLVSLIVQNNGSDAKFFILTEDEWLFQDVEYLTEELELNIGPFWIFPTYFEMRKGDSAEIHLLYQPISPGLHIERLCMICDNNSVQEIEIIGDSLEFSQNIIRVEVDSDSHICQKKHYCLSLGHIEKKARKTLQITIQNESNVVLELGYLFFNKPQDRVHDINKNWIVMEEKDDDWHLLPYATTDLDFDIVMDAQEVGYYSIFFDLFVRNVPLSSLVEDVEMIIYRTAGPVRTFNQCADVLVAEMEIACYVDTTEEKIEPSCACDPCEHPWQPNLTIVPRYLNFGILPVGLNVEKEFYVQNLTDETMDWKVFEVRYNIDRVPYSEILHQGNCDFNCGQFTNMWEHAKIMYKIIDKPPGNWVSILVLATCENDRIHTVEGICIVTYEVIEYDIVVKTGSSANPIICPMKLMYVDIPTQIKFTVENRSPITACFCLNKPYGTDIDKISLKLSPHSAIMKPNEIVEITAIIQSSEVGIFENTFIPCFFSLAQSPIVIRVLCAVDTLHVFFYLPEGSSSSFKKVIWPPKIVYEYGWSLGCPCEAENCLDCASEYLSSSSTLTDVRQYQQSFPSNYMKEHLEYDGCNISTESSVSEISAGGSLVAILKEQFGEDFLLQSNKVEVKVTASKPTSVVIYIENITPIATKFAIEAQNFPAKKNYNPSWTTLKFQKAKYIWNSLIDTDHGILVQPDIEHSDLKGFGWIKLNLWIYANTWGIYLEEIIVDIEDTPSFSFALLIDVTGIPIEFPMAKNAITKYPTVRLFPKKLEYSLIHLLLLSLN